MDVLLINDAEARQLSGEWNVVKAARAIRAMGPKVLVIKKGEHGVLMFTEHGSFGAPAYPLEQVFDPTGAGDAFAGGFVGYLASVQESEGNGDFDDDSLRRAVVMGSTLASFCGGGLQPAAAAEAHAERDRRALRRVREADPVREPVAAGRSRWGRPGSSGHREQRACQGRALDGGTGLVERGVHAEREDGGLAGSCRGGPRSGST